MDYKWPGWRLWLLAIVPLLFTGCTVIGWGMGSILESTIPRTQILRPSECAEMDSGTYVEVLVVGGKRLSGDYTGFADVAWDDYSFAYQRTINQLGGTWRLPQLGDTVLVTTADSLVRRGTYMGADAGVLRFKRLQTARPVNFKWNDVRRMSDAEDRPFDADTLRAIATAGQLPRMQGIALQIGRDRTVVPTDSVIQVQFQFENRAKMVGVCLGLVADGAVLYGVSLVNARHKEGHDQGYNDGRAAWSRDHPTGGR